MLKTLLITGHLIGLFVISLFISNEVTIIDNFPTNAKIGENYIVKATITKGSIEGFAKYQIQAPSGMSIKPIDLNGASFTFKDGKAKFIWMNMPNTKDFEITYQVSIDTGNPGTELEVTSKFLYLLDNERKVFQGQDHRVRIVGSDDIVDNSSSTNSSSTLNSDVSATRRITPEGDNKYLVEITINKLGVKGFAKIQDVVPVGVIATEITNQEAIFTQVGEKVKLVWFDIPKKIDLTVAYQLIVPADHPMDFPVEGKFHYMDGSDLKKVDVPAEMVKVGNSEIASTDTSQPETTTPAYSEPETTDNSDVATTTTQTVTQDDTGTIEVNTTTTKSNNSTSTSDVGNTTDNSDNYTSDFNKVADAVDYSKTDDNSTIIDTMENLNATNTSTSYTDATTETSSTTESTTQDANSNDNQNSNVENSSTNDSNNSSYTAPTTTEPVVAVKSDPIVAEPESTAVAVNDYYKDEVLEEDNSISNISNFSEPDTGVTYRVQIMAGKNVVGKTYLAKRHKFTSKFTIENHQGWIKYTTGSYNDYKTARDNRNDVRNGYNFDGPFVSAYNDGERITVQEALMITKQQWYN